MSKISLKKIEQYIKQNKQPETKDLEYGDFKLIVKTNLTQAEKKDLIKNIINDSNSYTSYSPIDYDTAFAIRFFSAVCDEIELPTIEIETVIGGEIKIETVIDSQKAYDLITGLNFLDRYMKDVNSELYFELENYLCDCIEFENQKIFAMYSQSNATSEAIDNFNALIFKGLDLIEVAINQLEKNGDKLQKGLTQKNINKILTNIFKGAVGETETANGTELLDVNFK